MTTRRRFLQGIAATGAWSLLGQRSVGASTLARGAPSIPSAATTTASLPDPSTAPFDHVVVLMFENRSFDHLLGWLPGSDGRQSGLQFTDQTGAVYPTYALAPDTQGCGYLDPDHSWEGFVAQFNGGALDGWLKTPANRDTSDTFPIGYYGAGDVPVIGALARSYTTLDRYFASFMGETFPNRFYQHAARTDRDHNMGIDQTTLGPTIWDSLAAKGLSGGYYFVDEPFLALWGAKYASIMHPVADFVAQAATGTLPNVSFVDPSFANEDQGQSGDYHPHGDIRAGESFLSLIYHAVRNSPAWDKTVLVVNFDEWGGFFDHVHPPQVVDDTVKAEKTPAGAPVPDYTQLGFRVPCIVASPWSAQQVYNDGPFEHTSVLNMIEWRWGLPALTARDANAKNLAETLDFSSPRTDTPDIPVTAGFASQVCSIASTPKRSPAPLDLGNAAGSTGSAGSTGAAVLAASATSASSGSVLPATGAREPLLAVAALVGGGMAIRAAHRRAVERAAADAEPVSKTQTAVVAEAVAGEDA
ncbi:MAG TPA: alkaline phosphatase family protein [Acidimicrobiales bacterium]